MPELFECGVALCNWNSRVTLYEFEDAYDPAYLNLDPNDENSWKVYAEKVRDIFSKCLGMPKVEMGYRHWKLFRAHYDKELALIDGRDPTEVEEEFQTKMKALKKKMAK